MTARTSQILLIISAFVTGLVVFSGVFLYATGNFGAAGTGSSAIGGPFKLIDQSGNSITDADIKGRPYLVFFGYTHCPDVCPTTLFDVSEVLRALGKDADRAGALFVTVDPERDTPAVMKDYLSASIRICEGPPVTAHPLMRSKRPIASMQRKFRRTMVITTWTTRPWSISWTNRAGLSLRSISSGDPKKPPPT